MKNSTLIRASSVLLGTSALVLPAFAPALAQGQVTRSGATVSVSAEGVNNPYFAAGAGNDDGLTAAVRVEVQPWIEITTGETTFDLEAFASGREFTNGQDFEDRYGARASVRSRVSARTTMSISANVESTNGRGNFDRFILGPIVDPEAEEPIVPVAPIPDEDITIVGDRGRVTNWGANAGLQHQLNGRESFTLGAGYREASFDSLTANDYSSISANAGYQNRLDAGTVIGFTAAVSQTDYKNQLTGDALTVQGQASLNQRLDSEWNLTLAAGAAATDVEETALRPGRSLVSLTVNSSLCSQTEMQSFCLDYSRAPQPSSLGGIRNSQSLGMSYRRKLSERDQLSLGAGYNRTGADFAAASPVPPVEYYSVRASLDRAFNRRVDGYIFGSGSRVDRADLNREPSYTFGVGVRLRFGDVR